MRGRAFSFPRRSSPPSSSRWRANRPHDIYLSGRCLSISGSNAFLPERARREALRGYVLIRCPSGGLAAGTLPLYGGAPLAHPCGDGADRHAADDRVKRVAMDTHPAADLEFQIRIAVGPALDAPTRDRKPGCRDAFCGI